MGILTKFARQENLRLPLGDDGREICLCYISKGEFARSCTRSHAPLQGHTRELVIRFIRGSREAMNKKINFDGVGAQASHVGSWDRSRYRNSEAQNGIIFGGRHGGRGGGRDGQNGGGGGGRGGNGATMNPLSHQDGKKNRGGGQNGQDGGRLA